MTEVDGYSSLPDDLKAELRSLLSTHDPSLLLRHTYARKRGSEPSQQDGYHDNTGSNHRWTFGHDQDDQSNTPATMATRSQSLLDNFKLDSEFHDEDTLEFQSKLDELKMIVGSDVGEELVKDLLLAADMDINRAANYYFNTQ